jgi:hypothetical protein
MAYRATFAYRYWMRSMMQQYAYRKERARAF